MPFQKKLLAETRAERFAETEVFIAKAKARLRSLGPGESPEWIEIGFREALLRDGQRIIADFYNYRELLPDNGSPRAFETIHRNRIRTVHSLFGPFELRRNYLHNAKSGSGRFPLDEVLGLEGACTPAVAKLMCKAASRAGSYQEAAADLFDYVALSFDSRDLGRMVDCQAITTSQIPDVLDQWRHPAHSAFRERTTWSLFNAFTEVHKSVNPHTAMRQGEALHGSFDATAGLVLAS